MDIKETSDAKEALEKKIAFYERQLASTLDQTQRGILVSKIDSAKKEIKKLNEKKVTPKIKKRIEDPTLGEKKMRKKTKYSETDGRGSVINVGSGVYNILL